MCNKIGLFFVLVFIGLTAEASFIKKVSQVLVRNVQKNSLDWLACQERELKRCEEHISFIERDRSKYMCDFKRRIDIEYWTGYVSLLRENIRELKEALNQR